MNPSLAIPAFLSLGLCACEMIKQPLSTSGDFNPMKTPGSNLSSSSGNSSFKPGEFVSAAMDNTGFYKTKPKADAKADKLLPRGTSMKVISHSGSFLKVELDSGEVGFVLAMMAAAPGAAVTSDPFAASATQVYPPLDNQFTAPLPPLPEGTLPADGVIPTVIDPNAPPSAQPTDTLPVQPTNPPAGSSPVPLPPNEEELANMKQGASTPTTTSEEKKVPAPESAPSSAPAPLPPGQ